MIDYDPHHWRGHLWDIKGSMVRQITARVLTCVCWSAAVWLADASLRPHGFSLAVSEMGHSLVGLVLGLLLVFRTNASYDRFWEGRKQWGAIVNESRNLARAASVLLAGDRSLAARTIHWTVAFAWSCLHRLRGTAGLGSVEQWLPAAEVAAVELSGHIPLAVARRITEQLDQARRQGLIGDYVQMQLDQNVQLLVDYIGACERIHNTPLPFAYVVHLRRLIILYSFTLPFALLDKFGWETIPVTFFIAYMLFGIEEIGVQIEDPIGEDDNDLPLEQICTKIETNLLEIAASLDPAAGVTELT